MMTNRFAITIFLSTVAAAVILTVLSCLGVYAYMNVSSFSVAEMHQTMIVMGFASVVSSVFGAVVYIFLWEKN